MRITMLGHAGLYLETQGGSILCDPWFTPAYFASWFPFPSNERIDPASIGSPTYLYISHLHRDHFDPDFLREHVSKDATVLLPDYPIDLLERELRRLGFHRFVHTRNCEDTVLPGGLHVAIMALTAPTDGPIGDSGLVVDDGSACVFNQNDSRPVDIDALLSWHPFDAHFLQYSGAIWFPMVYDFPKEQKQVLAMRKRQNQMERAMRYVDLLGARVVVPHAGPPCFLDDELFHLNDLDDDPANTFPDQQVFLGKLQEGGHDGRLMIPGSVLDLDHRRAAVRHPMPYDRVTAIFGQKEKYLRAYQERVRPGITAVMAALPDGQVDILARLTEWFEPLLEQADHTCQGINARLLIDCGEPQVVVDFANRRVHGWNGEHCKYRFAIARPLVESLIVRHCEDWVNELFLSCRFEAHREGRYNDFLYNFFKTLSEERMQYAEGWYAQQGGVRELCEIGGYVVQRRCPHLGADLSRFGVVEDGILTCRMHGWQFELATGRCLTSDDRRLLSRPQERATT